MSAWLAAGAALWLLLGCSAPPAPERGAPAATAANAPAAQAPAAPLAAAAPLQAPVVAAEPAPPSSAAAEPAPASSVARAPARQETAPLPPRRPAEAMPEYAGEIHGRFVERWFFSQALDRDMRYFVYLPPHYDSAQRAYPTLYLLHGASGEAEEWVAYGFVTRLDQEIAAGTVEPYLAVLPEGEFGYWINHAEDGYRWGDYVVQDLVAHVDGTYRTLPLGPRRAIGGLSMGGSGGLVHAFTHPTIFGVVGAHSPSLREDNSVVTILGEGAEFAARDPVSLARTAPGIERVRIWIDLGTEDQFRPRAEVLQAALRERGVPHQWTVWPGYHSEEYWTEHVPDYVRYYAQALHGS